MPRNFYTLIIVPNASSGLQKLRVSLSSIYCLASLLLVGIVIAFGLGFSYARMALKTADYSQLQAQNHELTVENKNMEVSTRQLNSKIENLQELSNRIQDLMESDTWNKRFGLLDTSGIGGSVGDYPTSEMISSLKARDTIDLVRFRSSELEIQLRLVEQIAERRLGKLTITPSAWPVSGQILSSYGRRRDPFNGQLETHKGVDIGGLYGSIVRAPANARVVYARRKSTYGNLIMLDHGNGITTRYGHLSRFSVSVGDQVQKGDLIGYVGNTGRSTGPHLHYEVRLHDRTVNPRNYLPSRPIRIAD